MADRGTVQLVPFLATKEISAYTPQQGRNNWSAKLFDISGEGGGGGSPTVPTVGQIWPRGNAS